eukprot:457619-Rhodomonas_salina.1
MKAPELLQGKALAPGSSIAYVNTARGTAHACHSAQGQHRRDTDYPSTTVRNQMQISAVPGTN